MFTRIVIEIYWNILLWWNKYIERQKYKNCENKFLTFVLIKIYLKISKILKKTCHLSPCKFIHTYVFFHVSMLLVWWNKQTKGETNKHSEYIFLMSLRVCVWINSENFGEKINITNISILKIYLNVVIYRIEFFYFFSHQRDKILSIKILSISLLIMPNHYVYI